jgi:integrase
MTQLTIEDQSLIFMERIQGRRRGPAKAKTIAAYRSHLDNWILPLLGEKPLAKVENGALKAFVSEIDSRLAPTSVAAVVSLVKQIVASAIDANGNQLYPRVWNNEFIDLPLIKRQDLDAPTIPSRSVTEAIRRAQKLDGCLYGLLAGSGLRIGEALALRFRDLDLTNKIVYVNSTLLPDGTIQPSPKTGAGVRQVDLTTELTRYLVDNIIVKVDNERLFPEPMSTAYDHLKKAGVDTGFHAFRRFRVTHLESQNVPVGIVKYWMGHAAADITERYQKFGNDILARKQWAEKAGLGFQLS